MMQKRKSDSGPDDRKEVHQVVGLDSFHKSLDKIFFSNTTITCKNDTDRVFNLVIELHCNFNLINALFHPNMGNWGGLHTGNRVKQPPFERAFMQLHQLNHGAVDIAEIYINMLDTSLIISKIHAQSISHQLGAILRSLSQNFVHFTKGLLEMPLEIFIPVFEKKGNNGSPDKQNDKQIKAIGGYFDFWGLYFLSKKNQDPIIYDLKNGRFIDGDLLLIGLET
ncbi:hypothetical protein [Allomuricauda sp. SCSIO 65647]|uniref:hypothetical protein n=1 Tax=Allomuricauda sp. SCSIO 65647 TaxID=2908843 RepID=UPI001F386DD6|nr:hypothetical protein [Muricauda sp. SCSIO 65647]UJH69133.1 hypothetical protein L0P89_07940 [Muricauda sp. SCSIO 65647]